MVFFLVILLVLGIPFIIGLVIGRAIGKPSDETTQNHRLAQAWEQGYHAGIQAQHAPAGEPQTPPQQTTPAVDVVPEPTVPAAEQQQPDVADPSNIQSTPAATAQHDHNIPPPPPIVPAATQPSAASSSPQTVQVKQATKEQRVTRNINITLYSATLLIVAAAALFIGAGLPTGLIITGLLAITVAFYTAGLILHAVAPRLQPAAIAFTGTAIALVPLNGLTWWMQTDISGSLIWFTASLLGLAMTFGATIRLQSTIGVYLTLPLLVSSVASGGASLQRGYVWALLLLILLSLAITWALKITERVRGDRQNTDTESFIDRYITVLGQTNVILVPVTVFVAWMMPTLLGSLEYFMLYLVATVYFVNAAFLGERRFHAAHMGASYLTGLLAALTAVQAFNMNAPTAYILVGSYLGLVAVVIYVMRMMALRAAQDTHMLGVGTLLGMVITYGLGAFIGFIYQVDLQPEPPGSWNPVWILFLVIAGAITAHRRTLPLTPGQRLLLTAWVPVLLLPVYVLYPYAGWAAIATTLTIIVVYGVHYRITTATKPAPYHDKYWIGHLAAAFGIVLATQIVQRLNDHPALAVLTVTILASLWITAAVTVRSKHVPAPYVPVVVWTSILGVLVVANIVTALAYGVQTSLMQTMVIGYALTLILHMVVTVRAVQQTPGAVGLARVHTGAIIAVQVLSVVVWQLFTTLWVTIAALAILAAWCYFIAAAQRIVTKTLARLGFAIAGQVSLMIAATLVVVEFGGTASVQRLVTAAVATAGVAVMALRSSNLLRPRDLILHRWFITTVVIGLAAVELTIGHDRLVVVAMLGMLTAVLALLGTAGGGVWLLSPTIWFAAWNLSAYPTTFNGALSGPLYSETVLVIATLAAAVALAGLYIRRRHELFARHDANLLHQAQYASGLVFLLLIGYGFSMSLSPYNLVLVVSGLFVATATACTYVAMMHRRIVHIIWGVLAGVLVTATYAYELLAHNLATDTWWVAPSVLWGIVAAGCLLLTAAGHQMLTTTRNITPIGELNMSILLRQCALVLFAGAAMWAVGYELAQPFASVHTAQAWTSAILAAMALWSLTIDISRDHKPFAKGTYDHHVHWAAQTVAVGLTTAMISSVWWATRIHPEPAHTRFWLWTIIVVVIIAWGARFILAQQAAAQRWRDVTWYVGGGIFVVNSVTLLTTGTGWMQLAGLLGFAVFGALGLVYGVRGLTILGAIGITASVLWYLRDLTFVWVGLLGLGLLAVAIWQLRRTSSGSSSDLGPASPDPSHRQEEVTVPPPPPPPHESRG